MFQHILVPTDFSKGSIQALEIAANIVSRDKGTISLLHVIEIISDTTFEEFQEFYTKLEKKAWGVIDALAAQFQDGQVEVKASVLFGNRAEKILWFALEHDINLIVINSHKIRPEDPVRGWGTISYKVGVLSQCPVMLVK